jgi:hypothetical protein
MRWPHRLSGRGNTKKTLISSPITGLLVPNTCSAIHTSMPESGLGDDFLAPAFFLQASARHFGIENDALPSSSSVDENMGTAAQQG